MPSTQPSWLDRVDRALQPTRRSVLVLFAAAFLIKLLYVIQSAESLYVTVPIMDSAYYLRMANDIMAGQIVRDQAFFMGPLYPYFLATVMGTFGKSLMLVRIVQIAGGAVVVVLTYLIARRLVRPTTAMLAAVMTALYGTLTFYEGQFLMMWLGTLLNMSALYVLYRMQGDGRVVKYVVFGVLVGLSALARANILILVPVVIAWILWVSNESRRILKSSIVIVTAAIAISPATIHNFLASGEFIATTSNGGVNFYIGNSEDATGIFYPPKGINLVTDDAVKKFVERELGKEMTDRDLSGYWYDEALSFIASQPGKELALLARKFAMFFNGYEVPQIEAYEVARDTHGTLRLLFLNFWVIVSLGLVGMVALAPRWRRYSLLYGYLLGFSLTIIMFFITARYRAQLAPVFCIFAAYALVHVVPEVLRRPRSHVGTLTLIVGLFVATQPGWFALPKEDVRWREHTHQARRLSEIGRYGEAIDEINRAIDIHPKYADSYIQRAVIQKERGKSFDAIADYSKAIELSPNLASIHYDLAQVLRRVKMLEPAVESYQRAIVLRPRMVEAHNNLGITYSAMGRHEAAVDAFERVIELNPRYTKAYNNLGATLAESGRLREAMGVFSKAIEIDPEYALSYKNLAMTYLQESRVQESYELLSRYVAMEPGDRHAEDTLARLRIVLQATPDSIPPPRGQ